MLSNVQILPPFVVGHKFLGLLYICEVAKEAMAITLQVLICLVTVQVAITLSMELKHFVSYAPAHFETLLERFLGLELIFLDLSLLSADLPHLETEIACLSLHELHAGSHHGRSLLHCEHIPHHGTGHAEHRSHEGLWHEHPLSLHNVEASHGRLESRHLLPHQEGTHPSCLKEEVRHHCYN